MKKTRENKTTEKEKKTLVKKRKIYNIVKKRVNKKKT